MSTIEAYVASNSLDWVEIRVRGTTRKPVVQAKRTTNAVDDDDDTTLLSFDVERSSVAGTWRCILMDPPMGTELVVNIEGGGSSSTLKIRTIDTSNLGRRLLRLGILADPHVNLSNYNGKRLYGAANFFLEKYGKKLITAHHVDRIILPGDVCDSGSKGELKVAAEILTSIRKTTNPNTSKEVPIHVVIGNHEQNPSLFHKLLVPESPHKGYYSINSDPTGSGGGGVHMIFLATDQQDCLNEGKEQLEWLRQDLKEAASTRHNIILVFLHYSLVLHPLHNKGRWDDGLQLLDNSRGVLEILHEYKHVVKAVICGHKNVPSSIVDSESGILHTLSPQLIQVPCGYDVVDVYQNGLIRTTFEIEEIHFQNISRHHAGEVDSQQRWGKQEHRSYRHNW